MTPEQALNNLYQASALAKLTSEEHRILAESAKLLHEIITPKPEVKEPKK
jgi:hypothetical protein